MQGLQLVVADIEAAHAELSGRGRGGQRDRGPALGLVRPLQRPGRKQLGRPAEPRPPVGCASSSPPRAARVSFHPLIPFIEASRRGGHEVIGGRPTAAGRGGGTRRVRVLGRRRTARGRAGRSMGPGHPRSRPRRRTRSWRRDLRRAQRPGHAAQPERGVRGVAARCRDPRAGRVRGGDRCRAARQSPTPGWRSRWRAWRWSDSRSPAPGSTRSTPAWLRRSGPRRTSPTFRRAGGPAVPPGRPTCIASGTPPPRRRVSRYRTGGTAHARPLVYVSSAPSRRHAHRRRCSTRRSSRPPPSCPPESCSRSGTATPTSTRSGRRPPTCA